ncbi:stage V sporulation protein AD [Shouchella lehensis]|uniref:Stage V sporulation protein AD n=1 Tax=Shouchella lehensis G1 TaxID=1246626 RepID=A0A060M0X4_9BACI|nr:stage V sporulation protein AD [Shouchella lehensis]AIC94208.1 stage V sporulation protein AD [Shouchella lehensis G1]
MVNKKRVIQFKTPVYVEERGTAVGPKEGSGPLGHGFDYVFPSLLCGEKDWQTAEKKMTEKAITYCLHKQRLKDNHLDLFIAGDLTNQSTVSSQIARNLHVPFIGSYSACATAIENCIVAGMWINGGGARHVLCASSSHIGGCEKQFRFPIEFAQQKPDTAQTTVTGAGAIILGRHQSMIQMTEGLLGKVIDLGINNPYELGAAMAPAAADTLLTYLQETEQKPSDFDLILTGDLARSGSEIFKKLLREHGVIVSENYDDCGVMMYGTNQQVLAGGSGAGCCATVVFGHIFNEMLANRLKRVLIIATGALHSANTVQQHKTIPCIAHAVVFERRGN